MSNEIKIYWDNPEEFLILTHEALRDMYGDTNLFDPGVWVLIGSGYHCDTLDDVLSEIEPEEEWVCDNCTIIGLEVARGIL